MAVPYLTFFGFGALALPGFKHLSALAVVYQIIGGKERGKIQTNLGTLNHDINRPRPSVLESIKRIAAEITGGVPGDRSSIVWPKANRNGVPPTVRRKHRKPFILPPEPLPSWCQNLKYEIASGPRKRKKSNVTKEAMGNLECVAVKNAIEQVTSRRGYPHLDTIGNFQIIHKKNSLGNREEWLSFPVRVIGDNGILKGKRDKRSDTSRKK